MATVREQIDQLKRQVNILYERGHLAEALGLAREATEKARQLLGEEHPETAQSLNDLGVLLHATGDLAGARTHLEEALAVRRRSLGKDHPDTAESLTNVGMLLQDMGDLAGARTH